MDQHITIRHGEVNDSAAIKSIYAEESTYSSTLQLPFPSLAKWEAKLGNLPTGHYNLVAEVNGNVVGQLGLQHLQTPRRKHVACFGIGVLAQYRGQGVGSKLVEAAIELADNWLDLKRLELEVYSDNVAAIALYQKYGFHEEGKAQAFAFRNGRFVDVCFMTRLRMPDV